MKPSPLALSNITKRYGLARGVEDISLELKTGEVFGFLGPNGSGKSTTIRLAMDFLRADSGEVALFGATKLESRRRQHDNVGYLAGDLALYNNMSGRKILEYLTRIGRKTDWDYVGALVEKFNAELDKPIHALSKGNRQKIGLIQAFMHRPKLLILDEPTSGLDPLMKQVFYDEVRAAVAQDATVFVSSHDLSEVQKICDRAGFIRDGKLISVSSMSQVLSVANRQYIVEFADQPKLAEFRALKSVQEVTQSGKTFAFSVSGDVAEFVTLLAKYRPHSLRERELELEELFMQYYKGRS